jgi:hypothetical protein
MLVLFLSKTLQQLAAQQSFKKLYTTEASVRGARKLTGENLNVVWAEFSILS